VLSVPGQLCFSYEIRKRLVSKPCLDTTFSVSELDDKQRNLRVPLFAFVRLYVRELELSTSLQVWQTCKVLLKDSRYQLSDFRWEQVQQFNCFWFSSSCSICWLRVSKRGFTRIRAEGMESAWKPDMFIIPSVDIIMPELKVAGINIQISGSYPING
jgi:hypothetical protein